ncbi:coproporphyrinogen III oxidase [Schleiferia thermophila str. Yellowstone]|jgi:coproporphyrinogen III oxidase|uniref:Coproporphyrinogen oxidase n=1 Tax=Schleiferia thermophila TaxID=884107 RepID=A0A368ZZ95_9FLAO|nr:coproporphyrinogen III oxidase [Schleiferia thermophila str. Yellowstone]RCX02275.1 coproporphyrinogen oxidase [Schleiferia thermophila]GCD80840.1 coproporphyrinogen oxidase [Schleiferia thermophila]
MQSIKEKFTEYIHNLQQRICTALEAEDGCSKFVEDQWERPGGGGGITRIISDGNVFEKGGVNTSVVHGELPEVMMQRLGANHRKFFACGISLVIHPRNPFVPTVHANFRYFELYDDEGKLVDSWFGGGADLTPYYIFEEDGRHFHSTLKDACDKHSIEYYPQFKKECDQYFYIAHRKENRGIGGIFFDYLRPDEQTSAAAWLNFVTDVGDVFLPAYIPIVQRRKDHPYTDEHLRWQGIRRGRYVEFNLIYDRGTLFGLKTDGRVESILMSLPTTARWEYDHRPAPGSAEAKLIKALLHRDWINTYEISDY